MYRSGNQIRLFPLPKEGKTFLPKPFLCLAIPILSTSTSCWYHHPWDNGSLYCYQGPLFIFSPLLFEPENETFTWLLCLICSLLTLDLFIVRNSRRKVVHQGKSSSKMKIIQKLFLFPQWKVSSSFLDGKTGDSQTYFYFDCQFKRSSANGYVFLVEKAVFQRCGPELHFRGSFLTSFLGSTDSVWCVAFPGSPKTHFLEELPCFCCVRFLLGIDCWSEVADSDSFWSVRCYIAQRCVDRFTYVWETKRPLLQFCNELHSA